MLVHQVLGCRIPRVLVHGAQGAPGPGVLVHRVPGVLVHGVQQLSGCWCTGCRVLGGAGARGVWSPGCSCTACQHPVHQLEGCQPTPVRHECPWGHGALHDGGCRKRQPPTPGSQAHASHALHDYGLVCLCIARGLEG